MSDIEIKFKDGDWAWSPFSGWREARILFSDRLYPIYHGLDCFTTSGKLRMDDVSPSLFTVEEAAKLGHYPPKRKVKKEIKAWANVYKDNIIFGVYTAREQALYSATSGPIAVAVEVTGTYEVEE
jgi:hypothetical protein